MKPYILILLLHFLSFSNIFAYSSSYNQYVVISKKGEKGPQNALINCFYKDCNNYLWIGTTGGIERYDGEIFLDYTYDINPELNKKILVNSITETDLKEIVVGTSDGLWKLNHKKNILEPYLEKEIRGNIKCLKKDNSGLLYAGTNNGLYIVCDNDVKHFYIDEFHSPTNFILDINLEDKESVMLLTPKGVVKYNPVTNSFRKSYFKNFNEWGNATTFVKNNDILYIGTENNFIITFDLHKDEYSVFSVKQESGISALEIKNGSILAVGTVNDGVVFIDIENENIISEFNTASDENSKLLADPVTCLMSDNERLWVGYKYYVGFDMIKTAGTPIKCFSTQNFSTNGLSVRSFLVNERHVLTGTRNGLYITDKKNGETTHIHKKSIIGDNILTSDIIFSLSEFNDKYIIGTCIGGAYLFDPKTNKLSRFSNEKIFTDNDIFKIEYDDKGNIWFATLEGLVRYEIRSGEIKIYDSSNCSLTSNIIWGIKYDSKGKLWVCTENGLRWFDEEKGLTKTDFPDLDYDIIRNIFETANGDLIFITHRFCKVYLVKKDLKNPIRLFTDVNFDIFNFIDDNKGNYWFGSSQGIIKTDKTFKNLSLLSIPEGLPDLCVNPGTFLEKSNDGLIWIANSGGLAFFNPDNTFIDSKVHITNLYNNGKEIYNESFSEHINIKTDENNIGFRVIDLNFNDNSKVKYEYKLEKSDTSWIELKGKNEINYYNLPSGNYIFKVRRYLDDNSLAQIEFKIAQSYTKFYLYSIVIIAIIIVLVCIVFLIRKFTVHNNHISNQEKEDETIDKYRFSKINDIQAAEIVDKLHIYMNDSKPYLNNDLKQSDLADALGYSSQLLSQVFNSYLNCRYYDYINKYRVEEFKRMAEDSNYNKYTLTSLSEMCGFSSQSSFFRSFKKITGQTPNEYIHSLDDRK